MIDGIKMSKQWLTPREFAERYQISIRTVQSMLQKGKLGHQRISKKDRRIHPQHIEQWLKDTDQPATLGDNGNSGSNDHEIKPCHEYSNTNVRHIGTPSSKAAAERKLNALLESR